MNEQAAPPESVRHHASDDPVAPVSGTERYSSMDMLRGVAVLGILIMNIYAYAMPFAAYLNPLLMGGTDSANLGTWFVTHVLADQKFMTIFSMLFGAGLILMMARAESKGAKFGRLFYRRQFWLLLIGAVHAYLIWVGDILFSYALMGMFVFLFRRRSPRTLIVIACLMLPVAPLFNFGFSIAMEDALQQAAEYETLRDDGTELTAEQQELLDQVDVMRAFILPDDAALQKDLDAYQGSYADNIRYRTPIAFMLQTQSVLFFILWRVAPLMMIGMAMMKLGVFTGERSRRFYRRMMIAGYGLGLPLTIFSAWNAHAHAFDSIYMMRIGMLPNYVGSILVALGHIGLVMLLYQRGALGWLMQRFVAVGRMALSNYLMHSVVFTAVFYGFGLGLYGALPRVGQMALVIAMIGLQLLISPWWLARYRFGPVEWLWRSLTYLRLQPMRR